MHHLTEIDPNRVVVEQNVRKTYDNRAISELQSSIMDCGVLQPIVVRPRQDGSYTLLIGWRRLIAAKQAGVKEVPAIIVEEQLDLDKILATRLAENLHRENLNPFDEAEAFAEFLKMGYNISSIAKKLGKSRYYISKRLRLLRLHPILREGVRCRTISPGHAHALLMLDDPEQQLAVANDIMRGKLSVMESRRRVREILGKGFRWRLIPIRLDTYDFDSLRKIAPEGDVKRLVEETIRKLVNANWFDTKMNDMSGTSETSVSHSPPIQ